MLKADLLELISHGENFGIEFKRDDCRPEQIAREIVALANLQGGRIILGVEDDGQITGIVRDNLEEWVMNVFAQKIHPLILPFYEEVKLDDTRRVAVVSFPQGVSKPYVVRHAGREEIMFAWARFQGWRPESSRPAFLPPVAFFTLKSCPSRGHHWIPLTGPGFSTTSPGCCGTLTFSRRTEAGLSGLKPWACWSRASMARSALSPAWCCLESRREDI